MVHLSWPAAGTGRGRHAGRTRQNAELWVWTFLWLGAAAFGTVPLTAGAPRVAAVYWGLAVAGLLCTWLAPRGRHRKKKTVIDKAPPP